MYRASDLYIWLTIRYLDPDKDQGRPNSTTLDQSTRDNTGPVGTPSSPASLVIPILFLICVAGSYAVLIFYVNGFCK